LSSHYRYGVLCSLQTLKSRHPRYQLDSSIALQIPFAYQPFLKFHANLLRWPGGYIARHKCEIGFPGVSASSQSHTTPKADYRGFSTSPETAKPASWPILATFPPTSQDCSQTPPFRYQEAIERSLASVSNRGQTTHPSCDSNIHA
jgi:hypothetical protein